ncbi:MULTISPECIES: BatA domain-containing protein [Flavobacteriaceae]|uniref:BatA domain-containing protein n=1 Tax=Flavobacteriaceae TaxID=49546 RepID=UPI001FEBC048|nr:MULTISPECIES: BatA domain-containing protein [Allomuricauda]MDC6364553.1 BatA domain-containing protein [Muricauda sp. AC10]
MQFKHPEILWALFLLIIPLLIHLFQLRRYKKTPFTNVAMLQKVVSESRKSNTLKKWLLLVTRSLLLAALVIAFAQPFVANETALKEKEVVVYLDDSFSMQARADGLTLLTKSVQELLKNVPPNSPFSLFTNEKTFKNVTLDDIQNNLLSLTFSHRQLTLDEIQLKANTLFSNSNATSKKLIIVSDFQQRIEATNTSFDSINEHHLVSVRPETTLNISIDSVYLQNDTQGQPQLGILVSGGNPDDNSPLSLYNGEILIAKNGAEFQDDGKATVEFTIPTDNILDGKLSIVDNGLTYDNQFYFNINEKEKVKVLAISESNSDFLERLYTDDEFLFTTYNLKSLDYSQLDQQNVVILNNLKTIPSSLQNVLRTFRENGGSLIIIPATESDLESYNSLLSNFQNTRFEELINLNKRITSISFEHPLFTNVFEEEVKNFQYPSVKQYFKSQTNAASILSFEGNDAFLSGFDGFYVFSSSLETENSNFKNSPLIVPTFYNMAVSGLKTPTLYYTTGQSNIVDLSIDLVNDQVLNVSKEGYDFIPLQQSFANRVRLTFDEVPETDGIFNINQNNEVLQKISFNYPRTESELNYLNLEQLEHVQVHGSIASLFDYLEAESNIATYWKWFVILALLLALIEVIIQKFIT